MLKQQLFTIGSSLNLLHITFFEYIYMYIYIKYRILEIICNFVNQIKKKKKQNKNKKNKQTSKPDYPKIQIVNTNYINISFLFVRLLTRKKKLIIILLLLCNIE